MVRCRPLPMGGQRQLRRAATLRCGRLHRLRHGGACRQRDAARGDRQLGVPVQDHERVRPSADPPRSSLQSLHPACYAPGLVLHEPPTHAARRVFAGYPGLVGSVPPTISALSALTYLCVPFARPGSPPMRRLRRSASAAAARGRFIFGEAAGLAVRDQALGQDRLHRPDPREHHGAHPAGRAVRPAAARAVSRLTRTCRTGTLWCRSLFENRFSGSVPPTLSALSALTYLCVPFARPGSPPMRRLRRSASAAAARGRFILVAAVCLAVRDQALGQERLHRPDPREHHGAHPAARAVRRAAARAVSWPTRAC